MSLTKMGVTVRIPKMLRDRTNGATLAEVQGSTVSECLADLMGQHPALEGALLDLEGRVLLQWLVYINDRMAARSDHVSLPLKDGDTIILVPLVAGG